MDYAITPKREENFALWYQRVVKLGDLAVTSPAKGCMIIRPNGYGIWQRIQYLLNRRIEETGHENIYMPLFIPISLFAKEETHAEGFAKEIAVVTHSKIKSVDGKIVVDPAAKLTEPYAVRPTSELLMGEHFRDVIQSRKDLPVLWNQWANVVRWEMRTRLFLRTAEFLWQEGHTAHTDEADARTETMKMLEVYREFAETELAMPVMVGEKPAHERFAGAANTYAIEAMMQDGKALQAGTSHYLGTGFARAANIRFQTGNGESAYCHTTSWGVSTRLIGGVIMTHGDDDGVRIPPRIAHTQVVIIPMVREDGGGDVIAYCERLASELRTQTFAGEPLRIKIDLRDHRSVIKRWEWIKRGTPLICEIGPRDVAGSVVTFLRRDQLRDERGIASHRVDAKAFVGTVGDRLAEIQSSLYNEARTRLESNIVTNLRTLEEISEYFGASADDAEPTDDTDDAESADPFRGWARVPWCRLDGAEYATVGDALKKLKLTIRIAPLAQDMRGQSCVFTGRPAVEEILIARAY